jgi:hypothetical protein
MRQKKHQILSTIWVQKNIMCDRNKIQLKGKLDMVTGEQDIA